MPSAGTHSVMPSGKNGMEMLAPPMMSAKSPIISAQAAMMSPNTSTPAKSLRRMSTTLPNTDTASATMGLALASGSQLALASVVSRIDCAVIFSPFISSFCRAERAAGTANHMMK